VGDRNLTTKLVVEPSERADPEVISSMLFFDLEERSSESETKIVSGTVIVYVMGTNGVQYLERSTWHCGCTRHWNAISGPSKSTMPILLIAILDSPFC